MFKSFQIGPKGICWRLSAIMKQACWNLDMIREAPKEMCFQQQHAAGRVFAFFNREPSWPEPNWAMEYHAVCKPHERYFAAAEQ